MTAVRLVSSVTISIFLLSSSVVYGAEVSSIDAGASPGGAGSAGFSVPFQLPAGSGGFGPSYGISYSSDAGMGAAGHGWDMPTDCISAQGKPAVNEFTNIEMQRAGIWELWQDGGGPAFPGAKSFWWNGQRILSCGGDGLGVNDDSLETSSCEADEINDENHGSYKYRYYRTAFNDSVAKIRAKLVELSRSDDLVESWTVTMKDGSTRIYGGTSASRYGVPQSGWSLNYLWCASSSLPKGHMDPASPGRIEYKYPGDTGYPANSFLFPGYPAAIWYGAQSNGSGFPVHKVEFDWGTPPSGATFPDLLAGSKPMQFAQRLKLAKISTLGKLADAYWLRYGDECGSNPILDGSPTCPTPLLSNDRWFLWRVYRFANSDANLMPGDPHETLYEFTYEDGSDVPFFASTSTNISVSPSAPSTTTQRWKFEDANADGASDLTRAGVSETYYHQVQAGNHVLTTSTSYPRPTAPSGQQSWGNLYISGSRWPDFITCSDCNPGSPPPYNWNLWSVNPQTLIYANTGSMGSVGGPGAGVLLIDLNGDGLSDKLTEQGGYINYGSQGFKFEPKWQLPGLNLQDSQTNQIWHKKIQGILDWMAGMRVADLNGDGLMDIVHSIEIVRHYQCTDSAAAQDYWDGWLMMGGEFYQGVRRRAAEETKNEYVDAENPPWPKVEQFLIHKAYINTGGRGYLPGSSWTVISHPGVVPVGLLKVTITRDDTELPLKPCKAYWEDFGQFADLNSDGLPDLVRSMKTPTSLSVNIALNRGNWVNLPTLPSHVWQSIPTGDPRLSGFPALDFCRAVTRSGFSVCDNLDDDFRNPEVRSLVDFDGDGRLDALSNPDASQGTLSGLNFLRGLQSGTTAKGPSLNRLIGIKSKLGGIQKYSYRSLANDSITTAYANPVAKIVVDSVATCPKGGELETCGNAIDDMVQRFSYQDPIYSDTARSVIGFKKRRSWTGERATFPYVQMTETSFSGFSDPLERDICFSNLPQSTIRSSVPLTSASTCSHSVSWSGGQAVVTSTGCGASQVLSTAIQKYEDWIPTTPTQLGNCNLALPKRSIKLQSSISTSHDSVTGKQLSTQNVVEYRQDPLPYKNDLKYDRVTQACVYKHENVDPTRVTCTPGFASKTTNEYLNITQNPKPWIHDLACRNWSYDSAGQEIGHTNIYYSAEAGDNCTASSTPSTWKPYQVVTNVPTGTPNSWTHTSVARTDYDGYFQNPKKSWTYAHRNGATGAWSKRTTTFQSYYLGALPEKTCVYTGDTDIPELIEQCWDRGKSRRTEMQYTHTAHPLLPTKVIDRLGFTGTSSGNFATNTYDSLWRLTKTQSFDFRNLCTSESSTDYGQLNGDPLNQSVATTTLLKLEGGTENVCTGASRETYTTRSYLDGMGRSYRTIAGTNTPDPRESLTTYNDLGGVTKVETKANGSVIEKTETVFDRFARPKETKKNSKTVARVSTGIVGFNGHDYHQAKSEILGNGSVKRTQRILKNSIGQMMYAFDRTGDSTYIDYAYDGSGRMIRTSLPPKPGTSGRIATEFIYDRQGRVVEIRDPNRSNCGNPADCPIRKAYDTAGNIIVESNAAGDTIQRIYDGTGRVTWQINCKRNGDGTYVTDGIAFNKYYNQGDPPVPGNPWDVFYPDQPQSLFFTLDFKPATVSNASLRSALLAACTTNMNKWSNDKEAAFLNDLESLDSDRNKKNMKPESQQTVVYRYNPAGQLLVRSEELKFPADPNAPLGAALFDKFMVSYTYRINEMAGAARDQRMIAYSKQGSDWVSKENDVVTMSYDQHGRLTARQSSKGRSVIQDYNPQGLLAYKDFGAPQGSPGHIVRQTFGYNNDPNSEHRHRLSSMSYQAASNRGLLTQGNFQYEPGTGKILSYTSAFFAGSAPVQQNFSVYKTFQYEPETGYLTGYQFGSVPGGFQYARGTFGYNILGSRDTSLTDEEFISSPLTSSRIVPVRHDAVR